MSDSKSKNPSPKLGELIALLKNGYAKSVRYHKQTGYILSASTALFGLILLLSLEYYFYLPMEVKSIMIGLTLLSALIVLIRFYKKSTPPSFQNFYTDFFNSIDDQKLQNAFDLNLFPDQKPSIFYEASIRSNLKHAELDDVENKLNSYLSGKSTTIFHRRSGATLLMLTAIFITISLSQTESAQRAFHFWQTYNQPNPFEFTVSPGDTILEQGSVFQPKITFKGNSTPDRIFLSFKTEIEESFRSRPMNVEGAQQFVSPEMELTGNIRYRVEMDGFSSDEYIAEVRVQPRFDELVAEVSPPSYTQLENSESEYPFSEISYYPGSEITFSGVSNKKLDQIILSQRADSNQIEFNSADSSFQFTLIPDQADTLQFSLVDTDGLENRNPYRIVLKTSEDRTPTVSILEPSGTVQNSNPETLSLQYRATDDFGLTRAELSWSLQRSFVDEPIEGSVELQTPGNGYTENYDWNLDELDLRPRDQVEVKIRVWDNDTETGPKIGESNSVTLLIPSLAENFEELDRRERDVQGDMDEISENFQNIDREYEEFMERLRQNPEGGFEEEQMMEDIREQQEEIDETVREMNERFEELSNEMMNNESVSDETQRAYRELQELMQELDDPALREAMEELQNALQNMSPEEIEEALENVSFNENLYRERLERTVELFKQLKMNSDLDKLAKQYEDLSDRLNPAQDQSPDELQNELQNTADDIETISDQLENLDQNPPENAQQKLKELKEQAQNRLEELDEEFENLENQVGDQIDRNEQQTDDETRQNQQNISEQLRQQAEEFRSARSQMNSQQIQVNILALQHALYTLLELSDSQEYITKDSGETRSRSQGFVNLARNQKVVADQFSITADTLFEVSSELPGVPNQINRKKAEVERSLRSSQDEMVERNQRNASIASREAFAGINDLASMLSSLIDQLMDQQNGNGGGGMSMQQMIEQLQNMSGDQQQLNQQLQEMINDMQGDRLSREEAERMDQLARQQNEIRRQLRDLQQRGGLDSGDRALSELQRMIEDMEESINDMRGGITDPIMNQRQQNILSRMLDAEEALQQRGETDEREGTASSEYDQTLPPDMTLEELQQEIRSRLQDPNYTPFSESYQRLIERYFEQLRRFERSGSQPD